MTKEEAKGLLDNLLGMVEDNQNNDYDKALRMGIQAIKTVEDFENAQIITGGRLNGRTYAYKCGLADGIRKASNSKFLEFVKPTLKWIPVKERLPEESLNSVIGWDAYRERCVFAQYIDGHFQITGRNESFNITAWMPLPEPYKPEKESEKMNIHFLKVVPEYFEALAEGKKGFEIRKDDRDYKEGDNLVLEEYNPEKKEYTGRTLTRRIIYVLRNAEQYGLREGFCILQIDKLHKNHKRLPLNQQEWIPTSERMPGAELDWVLAQVVDIDGFRWIPRVMEFVKNKNQWRDTEGHMFSIYYPTSKVVAWMPLPDDYKEGKESE